MDQQILDKAFLDVADRLSLLSRCKSKQVCAIATKDNRIIGTGINGSVDGALNCDEVFSEVTPENRAEHRAWSAKHELHAEENLIADAAKKGISLEGCTIYVNLQPCERCSLLVTRVKPARVVYRHIYDFGGALSELIQKENA